MMTVFAASGPVKWSTVSRVTATPLSPFAGEVSWMLVSCARRSRKNRVKSEALSVSNDRLFCTSGTWPIGCQRLALLSEEASSRTNPVAALGQESRTFCSGNTPIESFGAVGS